MIILRNYQEKAIQELREKANELLELKGDKTLVFKSPTGSGKTLMMALFLKKLVEYRPDTKSFSFIWTAPRKLHIQSKEKLKAYYFETKALRCVEFDELQDNQIQKDEILFMNWESINRPDNLYILENERGENLPRVIENTLEAGRVIVLIIDESHHSATTEISQELIRMMQAKLTVEVSATPNVSGDERVTVHREHVIAEGMIKKFISINPEFQNKIESQTTNELIVHTQAGESTNEFILRVALEKRAKLYNKLKQEDSKVNPLMLIQLPDARQGVADIKDEIIKILDENHGISVENGRLAIYLAEDKENLANITRNDSAVEVMIFKQAIALGWDCPRAAILALFRDWRSFTFSTQTLGRILRMPELRHYDKEELNIAYVYTNLSDFAIQEDFKGEFLTIKHASRRDIYKSISLKSVYSRRFREITRLSPQFIRDFLSASKEIGLRDKIDTDVTETTLSLIVNGTINDIDSKFLNIKEGEPENGYSANTIERVRTPIEVQRAFDLFIYNNLSPFYPESRSISKVKSAIYHFIKNNFPNNFPYNGSKAQFIVLDTQNQQHFIDVINLAKEKYQKRVEQREKELVIVESWEVPTSYNYSNRYKKREMNKSIFEPYYELDEPWITEEKFAKFLDKSLANVVWWFKNGDQDATFFAVPYEDNGEPHAFYVDWIVIFSDGRIGLFDTKSGQTARDAGPRAKGLTEYIAQQNQQGKNLFGGIVIEKNETFWLNDKQKYNYNENDLLGSGWEILN